MDIFKTVKANVTTRQAAKYYGLQVKPNGMACCPFHPDKHPSMKLDERYYCFGCHATGDVIDFVVNLHGIGKLDAARRLAEDFHLEFDQPTPCSRGKPPPTLEQRCEWLIQKTRRAFMAWRKAAISTLYKYDRFLEAQKDHYKPVTKDEGWSEPFTEALREKDTVALYFHVLQNEPFLSRQKDNYKEPYAVYAEDRPRQCVFGGTTNRLKFLPFDRTGNRRFIPIIVDMEQAKKHILADEQESRTYIEQVWAEAMEIYRSGQFTLTFSREMEVELNRLRMECMAEDTVAGRIQDYLDNLDGDYVCTLQIFKEGLDHPYDEPKRSDTNEVNEIMNNVVMGWKTGPTHRFSKYGIQRSWIRVSERAAKLPLRGSAILEERRQPDVNEGCKRSNPKPKFPDDFKEVDDPGNPFNEQCRMDLPQSP